MELPATTIQLQLEFPYARVSATSDEYLDCALRAIILSLSRVIRLKGRYGSNRTDCKPKIKQTLSDQTTSVHDGRPEKLELRGLASRPFEGQTERMILCPFFEEEPCRWVTAYEYSAETVGIRSTIVIRCRPGICTGDCLAYSKFSHKLSFGKSLEYAISHPVKRVLVSIVITSKGHSANN